MDVRFVLTLLFFIASCMPMEAGKGRLSSSSATDGTGTRTTDTATTWNYLGSKTTTITINVANLNNAYIIGSSVQKYLDSQADFTSQNYCLVSDFTLAGINYQLRSRIVPVSYYDFSLKTTVKVLRVDFNDVTNSTSTCASALMIQNSNGTYVTDSTTPASPKYNPADICPSCTSALTARKVRLFKKNLDLYEVPVTSINTNLLILGLDPNTSAGSGAGTCTNSDCMARGYSCCLENQCVNEGATRPSALTNYYTQWQSAEQEKLQNPLAYLNYSHLYYICGTVVPPPTTTTTGGSSGGTTTSGSGGGGYDAAFELLKKDYACIQHIKSESTMDPFHQEVLITAYSGLTDCLTAAADADKTMYYQTVMKRLYETCGCSKSTLSEMITSCPAYEYTVALSDANGIPTKIDCYTPPATTPITGSKDISVSARSAPHRFFDSTGVERDITATTTSYTQEGDKFEYLDSTKVVPVQENFGMNSILGQMTVSLDQTLPAKSVAVELDQVYLLSTTSGYYTPCPSCGKDSWFPSFSAFPATGHGTGLQAIGHTTERDAFGMNTTGGNYEDTIFGRACWLPPTMIPFSHTSSASILGTVSAKTQRQNRLKTQASLFINGYQRDWYGFNKGAMLGSFDGVTWFAIGKGRIVRANSKKLFLAINAPFADLASPSIHVVNISPYDGQSMAAQVDYDPQYHLSHAYQNEAGNCQASHFCDTDTDCVTRLGWEYVCADVRDLKTQWPEFDADANEKTGSSRVLTIDQILQQKSFPSSSTKRCVYRGAGAPCVTNVAGISDLNKRKNLTCAPNFYCANVSTTAFNSKIARYGAKLADIPLSKNHLYGKDANVLGRPLEYMTDSSLLPSTVASTLRANLANYETTARSTSGLCQPGKALPVSTNQTSLSNPYNQHMAMDTSRRADFINQIASCNSTLFTDYRHSSCPVFAADGNYEMFATSAIQAGYHLRARSQNACGLESLATTASLGQSADNLQNSSPFKRIESKPLATQTVLEPTLVRDACLRRAGQVCHTDLDCSPNKLHADQVDSFALSYFGNEAERSYYREYLVCGQAEPKPTVSTSDAFKNYQMNLNRCCREVGKDLTTYTADTPKSTMSDDFVTGTKGLLMSQAPGLAPNNAKRYTRLANVENLGSGSRPILTANHTRTIAGNLFTTPNIATPQQWLTLGEVNSETCCGGGWIRKFSDGGHDWSRRDRLYVDVSSFSCLNSRTLLITNPTELASLYNSAADVQNLVAQDLGYYCKDGTGATGSCAQFSFLDSTSDTGPTLSVPSSITINTVTPNFSSPNLDYYFTPRSADNNSQVYIDFSNTSANSRRNITILIPSYVSRSAFDAVHTGLGISMATDNNSTSVACTHTPGLNAMNSPVDDGSSYCGGGCCYSYDASTRVLKAVANGVGGFNNRKVGIKFTVNNPNTLVPQATPGTNSYYLRRLGRMELSGIPQVTFEPLYCSDNFNKIIPGIFKSGINTFTDFSQNNFSFLNGGTRYTTHHGLQSEPVFSENDFKCCTPLGKTTNDMSKCCSGYGSASTTNSGTYTCGLPGGTNLMVYFNRFVSNEGRGSEQPGGGLVDSDFSASTGEPLITATVNDKIRELGVAYCSKKAVRQGGAFGLFEPEPQGPETNLSSRIYGIVDSSRDIGQNSNAGKTYPTGYTAFMNGFRWNHHLYCEE